MQNASWGVRTLMACQLRFSTSTVAFVNMLLINVLGCLFLVGVGAWLALAASPGIAPGPPVSETGTLLITPRGKWSPGKVLPLRLLGVGQTRFYFTTGRKLAAGDGFAPSTSLSKSDELLITPSRSELNWWNRR